MAENEQDELLRLRKENEVLLALLCPGDAVPEQHRLRKLNDLLRRAVAESDLDCVYCGLPEADMAKCERGFPGCGRADDMMI